MCLQKKQKILCSRLVSSVENKEAKRCGLHWSAFLAHTLHYTECTPFLSLFLLSVEKGINSRRSNTTSVYPHQLQKTPNSLQAPKIETKAWDSVRLYCVIAIMTRDTFKNDRTQTRDSIGRAKMTAATAPTKSLPKLAKVLECHPDRKSLTNYPETKGLIIN